jgi:hypothetical protein
MLNLLRLRVMGLLIMSFYYLVGISLKITAVEAVDGRLF